ncbi:MAG: hypothetical protein ABUL72_06455, partial [Armatimonadota bacterium]
HVGSCPICQKFQTDQAHVLSHIKSEQMPAMDAGLLSRPRVRRGFSLTPWVVALAVGAAFAFPVYLAVQGRRSTVALGPGSTYHVIVRDFMQPENLPKAPNYQGELRQEQWTTPSKTRITQYGTTSGKAIVTNDWIIDPLTNQQTIRTPKEVVTSPVSTIVNPGERLPNFIDTKVVTRVGGWAPEKLVTERGGPVKKTILGVERSVNYVSVTGGGFFREIDYVDAQSGLLLEREIQSREGNDWPTQALTSYDYAPFSEAVFNVASLNVTFPSSPAMPAKRDIHP